jgi:hypothetical protein
MLELVPLDKPRTLTRSVRIVYIAGREPFWIFRVLEDGALAHESKPFKNESVGFPQFPGRFA